MIRKMLLIACALSATSMAWAVRVLEQHEGAYEIDPATATLPGSEAGSVIFRPCADCATVSLRVSSATLYEINHAPLRLEDFLRRTAELRDGDAGWGQALLTVYYDVETHRATRLALFHRAAATAGGN